MKNSTLHERVKKYRRDFEDLNGQAVFPFSPSATISTLQAADMLDVCKNTVHALIDDGSLQSRPVRLGVKGSPIRVLKDSVYRYMARVVDECALDAHDPAILAKTRRVSLGK